VYKRLSLAERYTIVQLRDVGQSIRQIAAAVDRPPSTISRELKRSGGSQVDCRAAYAEQRSRVRRWTGSKLERDDDQRDGLGRLKRDKGHQVVSYETIYRFFYA